MQEMKVSSCDPVWLLWRQGPSIACQEMARYVHVRSKVQRHGQTGTGGCGCSRTCILSKSPVHVRACCYRSLPTPFCLFRPDRSLSASSAGRVSNSLTLTFPPALAPPIPNASSSLDTPGAERKGRCRRRRRVGCVACGVVTTALGEWKKVERSGPRGRAPRRSLNDGGGRAAG